MVYRLAFIYFGWRGAIIALTLGALYDPCLPPWNGNTPRIGGSALFTILIAAVYLLLWRPGDESKARFFSYENAKTWREITFLRLSWSGWVKIPIFFPIYRAGEKIF
jgi:hypothetical protein